jgi:hypothetical protein
LMPKRSEMKPLERMPIINAMAMILTENQVELRTQFNDRELYNANVVKIYNDTGSLMRFESNKCFLLL